MESTIISKSYENEEKSMLTKIDEVKALLKDKHGIDVPDESDPFVARCLRLKDGNVEKSVSLILAFRACIADIRSWDTVLQPSYFEDFYNTYAYSPLLKIDRKGRRIIIVKFQYWDPKKLNFDEVVGATWMASQCLNKECVETQKNGYVLIIDYANFTLQHAWAIKQWRLLSLAKWATNGVVGRVKEIHAINHSKIVNAIYAAIKPFLKEKLRKRIFFHKNLDSLHQMIDPHGLPNYLGGDMDPDGDECIDKPFLKNAVLQDDYFKEMMNNSLPSK